MLRNQSPKDAAIQKILELQCEICKALAHPARLAIVDLLSDKEAAAAELIEALGISKTNISKNMNLLIHAGIVEGRREGRQVFYRLSDPQIQTACSIMKSILYRRLKQGESLALAIGSAGGR